MNKLFLRVLAKESSALHLKLINLDEQFEKKLAGLAFEQEKVGTPVVVDATVEKQGQTLKNYLNTLSELRIQINGELDNVDEKFEQLFSPTIDVSINEAFSALIDNNAENPVDINVAFQDIIDSFDSPVKTEDQNIITAAASFIHDMDMIDEEMVELNEVEVLGKKIDMIQKQLGNWMSVGWGQAGMTYGSGEVRLEFLDDVDRDTAMLDGLFLQYNEAQKKWIGAVETKAAFDPGGYQYVNDSTLKNISNDDDENGLMIAADEWTKLTCSGYVTNKLPTGTHSGIAGTTAWPGSGSTTYSRIWDIDDSRFYFDELTVDTVVFFRVKVDSIPESNNTLIACRINFRALADGDDGPVLEDATIASEYYITLEDGLGDIVDEDSSGGKFNLETGTDMGQGDYPGSYNDTNYKINLETATDGGTGNIVGDYFQTVNFQQTVSAQELTDGGGIEQERTFVFPIYVGDANSQRGYGEFEIFSSAEIIVNDTSILAVLS